MYQEIRLHGRINPSVEYFITAAGEQIFRGCFYEDQGDILRLFAPGNEFILDQHGITHRGNGGACCEYMFGVDQPLADLAKPEVCNRLVLFGAVYEDDGRLHFTDQTDGSISYERLFFDGNAVCNYFFFVSSPNRENLPMQQEDLLRRVGKTLKRYTELGADNDSRLLAECQPRLEKNQSLYLIKLIHTPHQLYHDRFAALYNADKNIPEQAFEELRELCRTMHIDQYQQERIRIDVMYKHPANRQIVDEYKNILLASNRQGRIDQLQKARLSRLKTLAVRNKIPDALFYPLDGLLKNEQLLTPDEPPYLAASRQILAGLFMQEQSIETELEKEDLLRLLDAKRLASANRDHGFEQLLLETGKICDEKIRDGGDLQLLETFSSLITYFDRFDNTAAIINNLAFMEGVRIGEDNLRSLLGNKKHFDSLAPRLYDELFFQDLLHNKYLGQFGRRKILSLWQGLLRIEEGQLTLTGLVDQLREIADNERLHHIVLNHVKDRIRNFYSRFNTPAEQDELRREINEDLAAKELIGATGVPKAVFREVLVNLKKEAFYVHNLLPRIIANRDVALREDFLDNSGLDRFYVEELEREYFALNHLQAEDLEPIRKALNN